MDSYVLKDIGLCKNKLIPVLLTSPDICETLLGKNYTEDDVDNVVYKQVFPYLYMDGTQDEVLPYICFEVDVPRIPTGTIKDIRLIIWCYCHKDCMRYSKKGYMGTRSDILADMIERQLRTSYKYGIGTPQLISCRYINTANYKYYGRELVFVIPDFKVKE